MVSESCSAFYYRFQGAADITWQARPDDSVENDRERTRDSVLTAYLLWQVRIPLGGAGTL